NAIGPDDGSNASSIAEITARGGAAVLGVLPFEPPAAREPQSTRAASSSPRPSPQQGAVDRRGVDHGGEGEGAAARSDSAVGAGDRAGRLRPLDILSRIDWLGLSAEIPPF